MNSVIRKFRDKADLTAEELADHIGYSKASVVQFENGGRKMSSEAAQKIAGLVKIAGGELDAETLQAVQWHHYVTERLPELKDEGKSPLEKVEVLQRMYRTLEKIAQMDVSDTIQQAAHKKMEDLEAAMYNLRVWMDKDQLYQSEPEFIEASEEMQEAIG